jgi:hypothetical protein
MNLSKDCKVTKVLAAAASAGTALNSSEVDMSGFEGVVFVGRIATANAANFANLAQSSVSGGTFVDLAGTKVVPGDDADSFLIDVYKPLDQFVRCEIDRGGADTATGDVYAIQYGASKRPVSHGTTVDAETHISPAEGTA